MTMRMFFCGYEKRLRLVEFFLALLAARALSVGGQVLEGNAVVLGGVVDIAADAADILARSFLCSEIHFGQHRRHGVVEIHHAVGLHYIFFLFFPSCKDM